MISEREGKDSYIWHSCKLRVSDQHAIAFSPAQWNDVTHDSK